MLVFAEEVRAALADRRPIVALESTIISHGMPYPKNLETARAVEEVVREGGAVPATIGILDGQIRIGLSADELERFASDKEVVKVSRRDLPVVVARRGNGATTVAATMICAAKAGIPVFVTGGIGGVHRDGQNTMDVSADLTELAHTSVAVVCAGAKAILDIGRTLEYLETHGVPVIGYQTDHFPAFYTRTSGFGVDARMDSPREVARMLSTKWALGLQGGVVIGNPVPTEDAMDEVQISQAIEAALILADERGIRGKDCTPFLLDQIKTTTQGRGLATNIALVKNNARVGAAIAVALSEQD